MSYNFKSWGSTQFESRYVYMLASYSTLMNVSITQLGYWIVEALVNRPEEAYPRGGLAYLVCTTKRKQIRFQISKMGQFDSVVACNG